MENLVIVESPAKAKTIEKFLGSKFTVKSSYGHIRDLAKKDFGIDLENNYTPNYVVDPDKKKIIAELKKDCKTAKIVWLASDEDREGEAIAWHLFEVLKLTKANTRRIVFHEITKEAIERAIENPREIDVNLVNAQQARRILDRLVGFELSPVLWKKIKPSLSAGRVQSVSVRILVEREREIMNFKSESSFRVISDFQTDDGNIFKAELNNRIKSKEDTLAFLEDCKSTSFNIQKVVTKPSKKSPAAPFTTSTLQQEASRKLGYSVSKTMSVAQRLYESGKITYMRTDSVNLSDTAIKGTSEMIVNSYGENYLHTRTYKTKAKGAQEAHEAIRPTYLNNPSVDGSSDEQRLYDLIWKRTIASQMSEAQFERTTADITISGKSEKFVAKGEILKFDGFLKVYMESTDDEKDDSLKELLPNLKEGSALTSNKIEATERFSHHPPRYTEASLVKKLEELGIGRPSTYAPTISTIQNRGYVAKEVREGKERKYDQLILELGQISDNQKKEITGAEKNKLFPLDIGMVVNDFLTEHFDKVVDFDFTAKVEKEFDAIAEGDIDWTKMIDSFYKPFHEKIETTTETGERQKGERELGVDPKSGRPITVRIGRYGPIAQIGSAEDEEKPKFASLLKSQLLETITFEEALELFKLPRDIGNYEDADVSVAIGRFGPYVKHKSKFYSLIKDIDDPMTIDLKRAIELIEVKREADRNKIIKEFKEEPDLQVLNGRWGPYIAYQKNNYKLPKEAKENPAGLTLQECMNIIKATPVKKGKVKGKKK